MPAPAPSRNLSPFALGVNANIKAELARRGKTDSLVRIETGLSPDALRRRKRGATAWTLDEVDSIADMLGISPSILTLVERDEAGSTPA